MKKTGKAAPKKQITTKAATKRAPSKRAPAKDVGDAVPSKTDAAPLDLATLRERIDGIDRHIQELIGERAQFANQVGKAKGKLAAAVDYYRPEREAQVLRRVVDRNDGPLNDEVLVRLFREIMSACLAQQEPLKIGYLGPEGTHSQQAVYTACRWRASRKCSRKLKLGTPISASFRWRTPRRARSSRRSTCFSPRS
jgi:chorismate mutase / prephenate dehydratase